MPRGGSHSSRQLEAVEYALWKRARILADLMLARPFATFRIRFEPSDAPQLRYAMTGWTPREWIDSGEGDQPWVRKLVESGEPITGPLIFGVHCDVAQLPTTIATIPPYVLFEGFHRIGAWWSTGCAYAIDAYLTLTQDPIPFTRRR